MRRRSLPMTLLSVAIFLVAIWSLSTRSGCPIAAFGRSRFLARLWTRSSTFLAWFGWGGARGTGSVAILRTFAFLANRRLDLRFRRSFGAFGGRRTLALLGRSGPFLRLFGWSNTGGAAILVAHGPTGRS